MSAGAFPVLPALSDPGERIQSLTYRERYAPVPLSTVYDPPRPHLTDGAPALLRSAVGSAWALVSVTAAGAVLVVLVLVVVRVVGAFT